MTNTYTSILAEAIQGFIREREALGYRYRKQAACLKRFDTLCREIAHFPQFLIQKDKNLLVVVRNL